MQQTLDSVQSDVQARVPQIIKDFTSQKDPKAEIQNKVKKQIWDLAWRLVEALITTAWGFNKATKEENFSALINWELEVVKASMELSAEALSEQIRLQHDKTNLEAQKKAGYSTSVGHVHLSQSYTEDLWGRSQNDENQNNIANMEQHAANLFTASRKAIKDHVEDLFNGTLYIATEIPTPALLTLMTADAQAYIMHAEHTTDTEK
jgi:hypothetical protein